MAHYVTEMGPMDGATAAGGRSCCNPPDAVHNHFNIARTRSEKPQPIHRGGPNGICYLVGQLLRFRVPPLLWPIQGR
jgi:hypothetical protein